MHSALATRSQAVTTSASTTVAAASAPTAAAAPTTAAVPAAAVPAAEVSSNNSRRTLLASLATATTAGVVFALSSPALPPANAAIGVWDGSSAASGSCAVGPDGDACRARTLAKDFGKKASGEEGGYGESIKASSGLATNTNSIPIPSMQGPYVSDTLALSSSIREYLALAPSDASRVPKGKALRKAGAVWAARYAPGGSARLKSARRCYISVDALQGHLAANGAAPYPASKASKLLEGLNNVEELLNKGQ